MTKHLIEPSVTVDVYRPSLPSARDGDELLSNLSKLVGHADVAAILALVLVVIAAFWRTIFLAAPITKVSRIAEWDSLFKQLPTNLPGQMDPSLVQLMLPNYMLVARAWHCLEVPLWNPYNACGCPLLADPQATALSPLHLPLALFPGLAAYNLILVGEVFLCALGVFLLSRQCGIGRLAGIFAALTFAFCPYVQWYMELLGNGYCLIPLLFWLFLRSAQKPDWRRAALAGVGSGTLILSGHPEVAFYGVTFGSFFLCASMLVKKQPCLAQRALLCLKQLTIAGLAAFCLSAPVLIPFAEFLQHADSYKFGLNAAESVPWQALALNLLQPGLGAASLFLGTIALVVIPLCLFARRAVRPHLLSIGILFAMSEAFTAKLWPLSEWLSHTPFKTLIVDYCQPIAIMLACLLAGIGLDSIIDRRPGETGKDRPLAIVLLLSAILVIALPPLLGAYHVPLSCANFDLTLPSMNWNYVDWRFDSLCLGAAIPLLLWARWGARRLMVLPVIACLALNFLCQYTQDKANFLPRPNFDYPVTSALEALSRVHGRLLATGDHLLKPNTNAIYKINDVRDHNPLFPERYLRFIERCGGSCDQFNQTFAAPLSPVINAASVSTVITQGPLWFKDYTAQPTIEDANLPLWKELEVSRISYVRDWHNQQLFGQITWKAQPEAAHFIYNIVALSDDGTPVWSSDYKPVKVGNNSVDFGACLPDMGGTHQLTVGMQLFDNRTLTFIPPLKSAIGTKAEAASGQQCPPLVGRLTSLPMPGTAEIGENLTGLKLRYQGENQIRIYDNQRSVPEAYLARRVKVANSPEQALQMVSAPYFETEHEVVLEASESPPKIEDCPVQMSPGMVALHHKGLNQVDIKIASNQPSILVLTHTFYPGWQATVDGRSAKIYHANYLFRGLVIGPGKHVVTFKYLPLSFLIGVALCLTCFLSMAAILLFERLKLQQKPSWKY